MKYRDFVIQLTEGGGRYLAQVGASQGETSWEFASPFSPSELNEIHLLMEGTVRQARRGAEVRDFQAMPVGPRDLPTCQSVGARLFRALFSEEVRPIYERELAVAQREKQGLRLRLRIDLNRPDLIVLFNLPWELLYNPDTQEFLGLSQDVAIVRYLDVKRRESTLKRPRKLRVLVVVAEPKDLPPLRLEDEVSSLKQRLSGSGVELAVLRNATRDSLHRTLSKRNFHVLHFMGHGDQRSEEGCIVLETPGGAADPLRASSLTQDLRGSTNLQLVILNACDTAEVPTSGAVSPFEGVAAALVLGGIPAVVGMRYPISDAAAVAFSEHFYRALVRGEPIDAATAAGRQAIFRLDDESFEWAKPILFLRSQKGEIWPSKAWSQIKKLVTTALLALAIGSLWFTGTRPRVRNWFELHFSEDGRRSVKEAERYWRDKFAWCNGGAYGLFAFNRPEDPGGRYQLIEFKKLGWQLEPLPVSAAAELEGIEYLARSSVRSISFRSVVAPSFEWAAWATPDKLPVTPSVAIVKRRGAWRAVESSPYVAELSSNQIDSFVPIDCAWVGSGIFDPSGLKAIWADTPLDIQRGNLSTAERKILLGRAWAPDDPQLLFFLAQLRFAQAEREPARAKRGALRRQGIEALITAARTSAPGQPDGRTLLDLLALLENLRDAICEQTGEIKNAHWVMFLLQAAAQLYLSSAESKDDVSLDPGRLFAEVVRDHHGSPLELLQEYGFCN